MSAAHRALAALGLLLLAGQGVQAATPVAQPPSIVGTWTVTFDWDCDGTTATAHWVVLADGSFTDSSGNAGTWTQNGRAFNMHYPVNHYDYTGQLRKQGARATGIIYSAADGDVGCWKARR